MQKINAARSGHQLLYRFRFGAVELDESKLELRVNGLLVPLEQKPLQVLLRLLRKANEAVSRAELLDEVWKGRVTVEHVLNNAIRKLRQGLGDDGACIVTMPRVGYRFEGALERTCVGQRLTSNLALSPGDSVPGRSDFVLETQLGGASGSEVWRAVSAAGVRHVFKFSLDGERLVALKREVSIHQLLRVAFGERADFVPILRWNFAAAPFYIELPYGGENLDAWAGGEQGLAAMPVAERIELFLQIADAIAAAHSVAVLHKDIKPANILVSRQAQGPRASVLDFGSGRLLEPGRLEELGISIANLTTTQNLDADSLAGTALYLAPELLTGRSPTVQSDLYALGQVLYQMLAGDLRRPMATGWEEHIEDPLLQEDIAAATAGDPARRLASVTELTGRLRSLDARRSRQAELVAVEQRARAAEEQLARQRVRRPWLIAAAASLLVGTTVSLLLYREATASWHRAERESRRQEVVNDFLNKMLQSADPSRPDGDRDRKLSDVLARAAEEAPGSFVDDPVAKGTVYMSLGNSYFGLGDYAAAAGYHKEAAQLLSGGAGTHDTATLEANYALARSLDMDSRHDDARATLDRADRAAGALLEDDPSLALLAHWTRGGNALMQMQAEVALPQFEAAERYRAIAAPDDLVWLVRVRTDLAWCYVRLRRSADAVKVLGELMGPAYTPKRVGAMDWTKLHLQYSLALMALTRYDDASRNLRDIIDQVGRTLGPDHYAAGVAWNHLTAVYVEAGDWDHALEAGKQAYRILSNSSGARGQAALSAFGDLGVITFLAGNVDTALPMLKDAHATLAEVTGDTNSLTQYVRFYLASALSDTGSLREAEALAARLSAEALASTYPTDDWPARLEGLKGRILLRQGRIEEARSSLGMAVTQLTRSGAQAWVVKPLRRALDEAGRAAQVRQ